eukprot:comp15590_c1_seq1/m.12699 comp15590_c1_seq1/g.12699  ORF comp15590_c1_seq1/g.12699 comp15590_c1_seq1/m.12699 type:complete len:342 (-) comp15590_c1_seq1:101-1126(-)
MFVLRRLTSLSSRRMMSSATEKLEKGTRILSHKGEGNSSFDDAYVAAHKHITETLGNSMKARRLQALLEDLSGFPLGRFMIKNRGLNGYWTDYVVEHPNRGRVGGTDKSGRPLTDAEKRLLDSYPGILATQERGAIFNRIIQSHIKEGCVLASCPSGLMRDLLGRDYSGIKQFKLVGLDLDPETLNMARDLAEEYSLSDKVELHITDAWALPYENTFNLLSSNGLNLYVDDDQKRLELYGSFYKALAPGGVLVTSMFNFPKGVMKVAPEEEEEGFDPSLPDPDAQEEANLVFRDVIRAGWRNFRPPSFTVKQLKMAGFETVEIEWDRHRRMPTFVARKPLV